MSKRKIYPKEFKLDAVILVLEQGYTKAEAGEAYQSEHAWPLD